MTDKAKQKAARLAEQQRTDFLSIMDTKQGRRFIWEQMGSCKVFEPVYNDLNSRMCINEGRRQHGLELLAKVNAYCPDKFAVMVTENQPEPEEATNDE